MLFLLASFSPSIRLSSHLVAAYGGAAGWVGILLSCGLFYGFILLLTALFKNRANAGLHEIAGRMLGRPVAFVLSAVTAVWVFVLCGFFLRDFAERLAATILPGTPIPFFLVILLAILAILMTGKWIDFVRFTVICFWLVLAGFGLVLLLCLPAVKGANLWPVTTLDAVPVLSAFYPMFGIFAYLGLLLYTGDEMEGLDKLKQYGGRCTLVLLAVNAAVFLCTDGVFGPRLTASMTFPFFMAVKSIRLLGAIGRLESLFILFWVITDIAIAAMLLHVLTSLLGKLTKVNDPVLMRTPLLLGLYIFSLCIVRSLFELTRFEETVVLAGNIILGIGVPVVLWGVMRLRRKLKMEN